MNEDELIIICGVIFVIFTIIFLIVLNKKQKNSIKNLEDKMKYLTESGGAGLRSGLESATTQLNTHI